MTLPEPRPLAERGPVTRAEFEAEIRPACHPVVLRGQAAAWPAVAAGRAGAEAGLAYLRRFATPAPVRSIVGPPEIGGRFFYADATLTALNFVRGQSPLGPLLDRLLRDREEDRPYAIAVQSTPVPQLLPGFAQANAIDLLGADVVPRAWLGNRVQVATHYDLKENVGVVVLGRRRFTLFAPEQLPNLYMGPLELTPAGTPVSLVDPAAPDLDRFPRYRAAMAAAYAAELDVGDAIYIPFHWWHAVASLDPVNLFVNYWWDPARVPGAPDLGNPYDTLLHALFALRPLPEDQRAAWRVMFDYLVFGTDGDPAAHLPAGARGPLSPADAAGFERMRATLLQSLR